VTGAQSNPNNSTQGQSWSWYDVGALSQTVGNPAALAFVGLKRAVINPIWDYLSGGTTPTGVATATYPTNTVGAVEKAIDTVSNAPATAATNVANSVSAATTAFTDKLNFFDPFSGGGSDSGPSGTFSLSGLAPIVLLIAAVFAIVAIWKAVF
jgi:hypothetical protein